MHVGQWKQQIYLLYAICCSKLFFLLYLPLEVHDCQPLAANKSAQYEQSETTELISKKLGGKIRHGPRKRPIHFLADLDNGAEPGLFFYFIYFKIAINLFFSFWDLWDERYESKNLQEPSNLSWVYSYYVISQGCWAFWYCIISKCFKWAAC